MVKNDTLLITNGGGEPELQSVNHDLICMADSWFVSMVASMSMVG
jgi:hypothetical protein